LHDIMSGCLVTNSKEIFRKEEISVGAGTSAT